MMDRVSVLFGGRATEVREILTRMKRMSQQRGALRESLERLKDEEKRFLEDHGKDLEERIARFSQCTQEIEEVQEKLRKVRTEFNGLQKKVEDVVAMFLTSLEGIFGGKSPSIMEINRRIRELDREEDKLDARLGDLQVERAELDTQVRGERAPLGSMRFALTYLRGSLAELKKRRQALSLELNRILREHVQFTPLSIWLQRCKRLDDGESLFRTIIALRKQLRMSACLVAAHQQLKAPKDPHIPPFYASAIRQDLHTETYPARGRIDMHGGGHHHRRETYRNSKGQRRTRWRKCGIQFDDHVDIHFDVQNRHWAPETTMKALLAGIQDSIAIGYRKGSRKKLLRLRKACRKQVKEGTALLRASLVKDED